jgi:hypothetical protein
MNLSKKIVSVAAGVALIAGAGAMASAPATAAPKAKKPTVKGESTISLPPSLVGAMAAKGITLNAKAGGKATVDGSTGYTNLSFPVTGPVEDGIVSHKGVLEIVSAGTQVTLTLTNPKLTYDTDGSGTGQLGGVLNGLPVWMEPFSSALNGSFREPFDVTNLEITVKKGKATKFGKAGFKRTDRVSATGMMLYTDDQDSANIFNTALLGPEGAATAPLFIPGMELGGIESNFSVTVYCKTAKECK